MRTNTTEELFSNPLDISDLITVCKTYSNLGWRIQSQTETIMEIGIEEAVSSGIVSTTSLPHIKDFLRQISQNELFGDASAQAVECIQLIDLYEENHPVFSIAN